MRKQRLLLASSAALLSGLMTLPLQADTLRIAIMGEPASLDPHKISGTWENDVVGDLFEGLVTEAADGERIPGVAESWEISDDGTEYTFELRDDARWSDGEVVTAEDFVYAFQRILNPATAADYAYLLYPVKNAETVYEGDADPETLGIEAVDDHTLKITLERSTPYFLDQLSHYTAYPVPKHVVEEHGDDWSRADHMVSNGPFKLERWRSQTRIEVSRNDQFHDADEVALDEVVYFPIEERTTALNRFRADEIDVARDFPTQQYDWLQENLPDATTTAPFLGIYYYTLNTRDGHPTADPRVREALSLAVRREVITNQILGTGEEPAYSFVPPGVNRYDAPQSSMADMSQEERMARAKELLAEAGYGPDDPLELNLRYNTSEDHRKVAIAIGAMWEPLGVEVELNNSEVAVHYEDMRQGDFDVGRAGWIGDYNDAQNFLSLLETGVANNYGAYSNEKFDALMDQASETQDLDERADIMAEAEKLALDETATLPIYYYVSRNLVNPDLQGWENNIEDIHRSRWVSFDD
ncbi:peptide ABC transporter substrate-binding protein [Aidingimonas halophila]|uniref:Oligopeptide transport system substrate-binding protein n=1 Tax=Aidingimonas halophila TaxID=574349 RepID=A0A1H3EGS5_9GAMM|nr:peptide ABC transporter substrate-binding protein [Aidingimonas halophila]GHC33542.1 peptide ABC transporter substrate-binding protein [Aidingimonas halophila]SDX77124.1 oligopeptide transport system substrate-binding protein [Aidingimonas halophila]